MSRLLLQPTVETLEAYCAFAVEHDLGFEVVDFAFPDLLDGGARATVDRYRATLADESRLVSIHGPFLDLYVNSPDAAIRRVAKERITQTLAIADELQLEFVVFHTNCLPMMGRDAYYQRWVDAHVDLWREVTALHDITVVLENMWDKSPELIARVLDGVDSPRLKVCLDTGHHHLFSRESLERWFSCLGENIAYLHLTDNMGDFDSELVLGTGVVRWREMTALVDRYCDRPVAVIETAGLEGIRASLSFLRREHVYPFDVGEPGA